MLQTREFSVSVVSTMVGSTLAGATSMSYVGLKCRVPRPSALKPPAPSSHQLPNDRVLGSKLGLPAVKKAGKGVFHGLVVSLRPESGHISG